MKRILFTYLLIWILSVGSFWLFGSSDAIAYSILVFYLILPISTILLSVLIIKNKHNVKSYSFIFFFGIMYMMANYCTFLLKNGIAFNKINLPNISHIIPGIVCSIIGMRIGRKIRKR